MSSTTLTMFETCCTMDRWQQIGYFTYKAKLRQDINDDWIDIDHDIWVSFSTFHFVFISFLRSLFWYRLSPHVFCYRSNSFFRQHVLPGSGFSIFPARLVSHIFFSFFSCTLSIYPFPFESPFSPPFCFCRGIASTLARVRHLAVILSTCCRVQISAVR